MTGSEPRTADPLGACIERALTLLSEAFAEANARRANAFDPLRGLYVTEREVESILAEAEIAAERTPREPFELPALLAFGADPFMHDVVALAIAAEYVPRLDRVVGFLHDDLTRRTLTVGLLAQVLGTTPDERRHVCELLAGGPLERWRIVTRTDAGVPLHDALRIDPGFLAYVRGGDPLDARLHSYVTRLDASAAPSRGGAPLAAETVVLWGTSADAVAAAARRRAGGRGAFRAGAAIEPQLLALAVRDAALAGRVLIVECTDPVRARDAVTACENAPVPVLIEAPCGIVRYDGPTERVEEGARDAVVASAGYPLPYGRRVRPRRGFADLVLPRAPYRAVVAVSERVAHQHRVRDDWGVDTGSSAGGVRALFGGPPGTGKTLAAETLAHALGRDLYVVDVSTVVSKYIGETEKALGTVFAEAARANVCLFFDEADALFGKRTETKDAHDRYANLETAFLLQALDLYPDIVVLATNLLTNLDDALTRRIDVMIEFPMPDAASREVLWRRALAAAPCEDVALRPLAERFPLSGGHIRNAAVAAAFRAASESRSIVALDLVRAARDELTKLGRVPGRIELGEHYDALRAEEA